jgi:hypothetical protein
MLRWLPLGIFALVLLLSMAHPANADTGTYQISNYILTLEPQSSGKVQITCEQDWKVLSGHIPWITVGLPNSSFSIGEFGQAAAKVAADNSGGWSGVRIDLDRDYLPGETFKIEFSVLQGNLLERLTNEKKWRINYTPGWYDNAPVDHLQINLVSPANIDSYSSISPPSSSTKDNIITWERTNLPRGARFTVNVESLDGSFLSATAQVKGKSGPNWGVIALIGVGIIIVYLLIMLAVRRSRQVRDAQIKDRIAATEKAMAEDKEKREEIEKGFKEYVDEKGLKPDAEGRYYDRGYGNYITPIIWGAVLMHQQRANRASEQPPRNTRSCACACVSCACACACACAGGGAAGCSRKSLHQCKKCEMNNNLCS